MVETPHYPSEQQNLVTELRPCHDIDTLTVGIRQLLELQVMNPRALLFCVKLGNMHAAI